MAVVTATLWAAVPPAGAVAASRTFVHVATPANTSLNSTFIDNPLTNGNPNAVLLVTPNWNPGGGSGVYDNHNVGVSYDPATDKWSVFNQDLAPMPDGAAFNVEVAPSGAAAFVQRADFANTYTYATFFNYYLTNGNPDALIFATSNKNPRGGVAPYDNHAIGVYYNASFTKWSAFNQDLATMPDGTAFNVEIVPAGPSSFVQRASPANTTTNATFIDNPLTNGHPNALVFATPNWNPGGGDGTYDNHPIGVYYEPSVGRWAIFNQDLAPMPGGAAFNVDVATGVHPMADYDGDAKADIAVFRPSTGAWYVRNSGGGSTVTNWGTTGDVAVAGDYDGDARTDIAVFRPSTGTWYVKNSGGGSTVTNWGTTGDVAVAGDYDGDARTDIAVFRPSTGTWYLELSGGGNTVRAWGASGDVAVPGDYDGDAKTDVAVFRPSTGTWYINNSGGGSTVTAWGAFGDIAVPGDYDGDAKTDIAVFRPSTGTWYINLSGGGSTVTSWGGSGDIPVPGDYNGDAKSDNAVFRPSTGTWYINLSGSGSTVTAWGTSGDAPIGQPPGT